MIPYRPLPLPFPRPLPSFRSLGLAVAAGFFLSSCTVGSEFTGKTACKDAEFLKLNNVPFFTPEQQKDMQCKNSCLYAKKRAEIECEKQSFDTTTSDLVPSSPPPEFLKPESTAPLPLSQTQK